MSRDFHGRLYIFEKTLAVMLRVDIRGARLEAGTLTTASQGVERVLLADRS